MKTPRTDRNERIVLGGVGGDWKVVTSDFARQLETELQVMTALADSLAETLSELMAMRHKCFIPNEGDWWDNEASATLTDYEKHKKGIKP